MIDFNWTELLVLGVIAVILFGPEKLPDFARKAARVLQYLRQVGNDARGQLRAELGPEFDDLRLSDLNPRNFVSRHLLTEQDKDDLLSIRDELKGVSSMASGEIQGVRDAAEGAGSTAETEPTPEPARPSTPYDPEAT